MSCCAGTQEAGEVKELDVLQDSCCRLTGGVEDWCEGFFFNWSPPKFAKYKIPCKLARNFSKCQRLGRDLYLENLGGLQLKKTHPVAGEAGEVKE